MISVTPGSKPAAWQACLAGSFTTSGALRSEILSARASRAKYDQEAKLQLHKERGYGAGGFEQFLRGLSEKSHIADIIYFGDSRESRAL
jgi:hypothetical protein